MRLSTVDSLVAEWIARSSQCLALRKILQRPPESGCSAPATSNETGHVVLALSALSRTGYITGEFKPVAPTAEMLGAQLADGDLLISRSNTRERVGFVGIYRHDSHDAVSFPDTMMRLRPRQELMRVPALELVLQSSRLRKQIMAISAGTSASMKKINKTNLLKLEVPLPTIKQQDAALEQYAQVRKSLDELAYRASAAKLMHSTLLNQVLRD